MTPRKQLRNCLPANLGMSILTARKPLTGHKDPLAMLSSQALSTVGCDNGKLPRKGAPRKSTQPRRSQKTDKSYGTHGPYFAAIRRKGLPTRRRDSGALSAWHPCQCSHDAANRSSRFGGSHSANWTDRKKKFVIHRAELNHSASSSHQPPPPRSRLYTSRRHHTKHPPQESDVRPPLPAQATLGTLSLARVFKSTNLSFATQLQLRRSGMSLSEEIA